MSIDATIDSFFEPIARSLASVVFYDITLTETLGVKAVLIWLVLGAVFFTFYLGFVNLRYFVHAVSLIFKKEDKKTDGQISRFQALATSLSGTIGLGNIAGVAVAVSLGGPGAVFWMIVMALFSMSLKFAEVTCGVQYREHADKDHPDRIFGGPMYYIRAAFRMRNMPRAGAFFSGFFAFCLMLGAFGAASVFQTNQVYQQLLNISGGEESFAYGYGWLFGLFMVFIVGLVIIGGIRSIARVTSKIVPIMGLVYVLTSLTVIVTHAYAIPGALMIIFESALYPEAGLGAVVGALLMGVQRATFSNESGFGTAAVAHSAVKTDQPVSQGMVGMLGPFIDTIVICLMTGLVIVTTGAYIEGTGIEGVELTSRAFESGVSWFPYVLFVVVFLFAYSTLISWSYYGVKSFTYLFGTTVFVENFYKFLFCVFIVIGASAELSNVILFTDAMVFAMTIPNLIGLYMLAPQIKRDLDAYTKTIKSA